MLLKKFLFIPFLLCSFHALLAQQTTPAWDDTKPAAWASPFQEISIQSSADGQGQKAWLYKSTANTPQPLIVSLHTWSADYMQEDPLAQEAVLRNWNYIHPDFRGPNNRAQAAGSKLVITDLEDAVNFAVEYCKANRDNVHVIGVSGGGHAVLLAYMQLAYPVKTFDAWVPISSLEDWYWENKGRKSKYALDLENVMGGDDSATIASLAGRSPISLPVPVQRNSSTLRIYTGIHDGYTGSVPITQSIRFYNKLVKSREPGNAEALVTDSLMLSLVTKRISPTALPAQTIGQRTIHLHREIPGVSLFVFEGTHEMLSDVALSLLKPTQVNAEVLTIGDSNGAFAFGWPAQLRKLLPFSHLINFSIPGNTIGFDNLGKKELNSLYNLEKYLDSAENRKRTGRKIDYIILGLGTNDAKESYSRVQHQVAQNMENLVEQTQAYYHQNHLPLPKIILLLPPPIEQDKTLEKKYNGAAKRVAANNIIFTRIARKFGASVADAHALLLAEHNFTSDGIHLRPTAQFAVAELLQSMIK